MIAALTTLLLCQCAGEILVRAFHLPLPGPVAGLGLLFFFLVLRGRGAADGNNAIPAELGAVSDVLLKNLALLFIPASVGTVQYLGVLRSYALQITIVIAGSTTLALATTALTFSFVARKYHARETRLPATSENGADRA